MSVMDATALRLVDGYRANWSHRKAFHCAAGVAGHETCSTAVRNSLATKGFWRSIAPAAQQFGTCAMSAWGMRGQGGQPGYGAPRRRAGVQGVFCCGPIPIPFKF